RSRRAGSELRGEQRGERAERGHPDERARARLHPAYRAAPSHTAPDVVETLLERERLGDEVVGRAAEQRAEVGAHAMSSRVRSRPPAGGGAATGGGSGGGGAERRGERVRGVGEVALDRA